MNRYGGENCNIGSLCCSTHCEQGHSERIAMCWIGATEERKHYTFGDLERVSNQFANALSRLGFKAG
jgi:acetyl-CoA synthetase